MPIYNKAEIGRIAQQHGFVRDTFEKVLRLKEILEYMNRQEYLKEHLILKGGTAINLAVFNLPRLSVDIDLDYIPNDSKENMHIARENITALIREYMEEEGYQLSSESRFTHSLDSFHCQYINSAGNRDMIKVDINYSLREHILEPVCRAVLPKAFDNAMMIRMVAPMEIFAAKGNALISRAAARDLYDWGNLIDEKLFEDDRDMFRKCIVFYATISSETINKNFDTAAIDSLDFYKIRRELFPVLCKKDNFMLEDRKRQAKKYISDLMQLTEREKEYINRFEAKEYHPELLFDDSAIVARLESHPMAMWKMMQKG